MGSLCNLSGGALLLPNVPYDAEIEYLESDGNSYIDTEILDITAFDVFSANVATQYPSNSMVFGYSNSIAKYYYDLLLYHPTKRNTELAWGLSSQNSSINVSNVSISDFHVYRTEIINSQLHFLIDDIDKGNLVVSSYANGQSLYLFGRNNKNIAGNLSKIRLKNFKYIRDNQVVRDYIPVRKGTTGYMYDKVSGQLFGNAGTGNFILGNDI